MKRRDFMYEEGSKEGQQRGSILEGNLRRRNIEGERWR